MRESRVVGMALVLVAQADQVRDLAMGFGWGFDDRIGHVHHRAVRERDSARDRPRQNDVGSGVGAWGVVHESPFVAVVFFAAGLARDAITPSSVFASGGATTCL